MIVTLVGIMLTEGDILGKTSALGLNDIVGIGVGCTVGEFVTTSLFVGE